MFFDETAAQSGMARFYATFSHAYGASGRQYDDWKGAAFSFCDRDILYKPFEAFTREQQLRRVFLAINTAPGRATRICEVAGYPVCWIRPLRSPANNHEVHFTMGRREQAHSNQVQRQASHADPHQHANQDIGREMHAKEDT